MDSNEINICAKQLRIHTFLGVFAADQLCNINKDDTGVFICNTEASYESGQHWIGISLCPNKIIYFDSLNGRFHESSYMKKFIRRIDKDFLRNDIQIQTYNSDKCGIHSLVFCYVLCKKRDNMVFTRFLSSFAASHKIKDREKLSMNYFLLILPLQNGGYFRR